MSSEAPSIHRVIGGQDQRAGVSSLAELFALDRTADGWRNRLSLLNLGSNMMGGQIAGLGMKAAALSAPGLTANAIHVLFLSAPDPDLPCELFVEPLRDGRRLAHRLTRIMQRDRLRVQVITGFAAPDLAASGPDYSCALSPPKVPLPEGLPTRAAQLAEGIEPGSIQDLILRGFPFLDIRFVPDADPNDEGSRFWVRVPGATGMDDVDQLAMLTIISDYWCTLPVHRLPGAREAMGDDFITTSLDHALWFEAVPDCGEWMLADMRALTAGRGVATMQLRMWTQDLRPLANCIQQCLLVPRGE